MCYKGETFIPRNVYLEIFDLPLRVLLIMIHFLFFIFNIISSADVSPPEYRRFIS